MCRRKVFGASTDTEAVVGLLNVMMFNGMVGLKEDHLYLNNYSIVIAIKNKIYMSY